MSGISSVAVYTASNRHRRARVSAGLLMYRGRDAELEVFIAHPGGPWFPHRDTDVWTIPKGELEPGEDLLAAAIREFEEEVGIKPKGPYLELGSIRQKGGKTVHAWAFEGDHPDDEPVKSNRVDIEWPPGSGKWGSWPEIDRAGFFPVAASRTKLKQSQHPLLDRLVQAVGASI
ncbi:MAG: NUDIX domain-containing protein [Verrucomicrobia bacterium]|nr:MAG: NUDIX domain-containing protein [Verrucomicrobiota bacterium]